MASWIVVVVLFGILVFYGSSAYAESASSYVFDSFRLTTTLARDDSELHSRATFGLCGGRAAVLG